MSKLKIGDKVIVKQNVLGVIKGRDVIEQPDGKVRIEYVVKTGEGFDNWGVYTRKDLKKANNAPKKKQLPTLVVDAPNGYKVTLVALTNREAVFKETFDKDGFFTPYYRNGKKLTVGYSIYNPNDEFNSEVGLKIAIHRAKKKPFCSLVSEFSGEFNKETVEAILKVKGEYIAKNIEDFVSK